MKTRHDSKKILIGLSGGIACYKIAELIRLCKKAHIEVQVVMTESATRFITPMTLQALSGQAVFTDAWDDRIDNHMPHIELTRDVDAILIAPCTTNMMHKIAQGVCDDLLSTVAIARPAKIPLLIAPAMNHEMWQNPATQRTLQQLIADDITVLGPASGEQACGEEGMGRMLEAQELFEHINALFLPKLFSGQSILITAGPTVEAIDPVRAITNYSSGKMGYAIAQAAVEAGAKVTLISGPTALNIPANVDYIGVQSAQQMYDAVMQYIRTQNLFIATAAVADWHVVNKQTQKIKKHAEQKMTLELAPNPDILASVAALTNPPFCIGFAAESNNVLEYARAKRIAKKIPLIIANQVPSAFGNDENELIVIDENGHSVLPRKNKLNLARQLMSEIAKRFFQQYKKDIHEAC